MRKKTILMIAALVLTCTGCSVGETTEIATIALGSLKDADVQEISSTESSIWNTTSNDSMTIAESQEDIYGNGYDMQPIYGVQEFKYQEPIAQMKQEEVLPGLTLSEINLVSKHGTDVIHFFLPEEYEWDDWITDNETFIYSRDMSVAIERIDGLTDSATLSDIGFMAAEQVRDGVIKEPFIGEKEAQKAALLVGDSAYVLTCVDNPQAYATILEQMCLYSADLMPMSNFVVDTGNAENSINYFGDIDASELSLLISEDMNKPRILLVSDESYIVFDVYIGSLEEARNNVLRRLAVADYEYEEFYPSRVYATEDSIYLESILGSAYVYKMSNNKNAIVYGYGLDSIELLSAFALQMNMQFE